MTSFPQHDRPDLFAQARGCLERRDFSQAIQLLQRARNVEPTNDHILLELGFLHALAFDFVAAEKCFNDAVRVAPSRTDALMEAGHHWRNVQKFDAAKACFEKILEQTHVPIMALIRLAEIHERQRHLDHATEMAERALHMDPHHGGALLVRARIHRQRNELPQAERLLRMALGKAQSDNDVAIAAWYQLGNVLDAQGRYDDAMSAFLQGKALQRTGTAPLLAAQHAKQRSMRQAADAFTPQRLEQWRKLGEAQLQPARNVALLCGYPRSGTTLLEYVLDSHPQIIGADETDVWPNKIYGEVVKMGQGDTLLSMLDSLSARNLRQLRLDYLQSVEACLGRKVGEHLLVEKQPSLTSDIPVIMRLFPEMKLIVALRDPRDVCLSCFMQPTPINPDTACWLTLEGTIDNYASIMNFWLRIRPTMANAAIEVRYERMVEHFEPTARQVLEFLKLPWDERLLRFDEHARTKTVVSPTYAEVTRPLFNTAIGRWQNYRKCFEPHLHKLAPFVREFCE